MGKALIAGDLSTNGFTHMKNGLFTSSLGLMGELYAYANVNAYANVSVSGELQIGSGLYGGKIYKSLNPYELVIDPFGIDSSGNISDASGQVTIMGDLVVRGNTTTISSTSIDISDIKLTLASASGADSSLGDGGGIELGNGYASMIWNNSTLRWTFNKGVDISGGLTIKSSMATTGSAIKIPTTLANFRVTYSEYLTESLDPSGIQATGVWHDISGWTITYLAMLSGFSRNQV